MASDNLMTMEQQSWMYRPTFGDAFYSDFFNNKETETLTKALQKSFNSNSNSNSNNENDLFSPELVESLFAQPEITPAQTPTASGGSENEVQISSKSRRNLPPSGRVTKRKSRASKRATTTFITADPANFRQMVQQVTGVRFNGQIQPEPQRVGISRFGGGLQTLDTSSFFVDGSGYVAQIPAPAMVSGDGGGAGSEFDGFCSFPTLESWKVM